ncbi:MAG: hypothetical protein LWX83_11595 [Anaerolineae bacterium]|nr:hypothetical protein [Anaerolineae bacterium]
MKYPMRILIPLLIIAVILLAAAVYKLAPYFLFSPKDCLGASYTNLFVGEAPDLGRRLSQQEVDAILQALRARMPAEIEGQHVLAGYISTLPGIEHRKAWQWQEDLSVSEIPVDDFIRAWSSSPAPDLPWRVYNVSFFNEKDGFVCVRMDARYNAGLRPTSRGGFSEIWVFRKQLLPPWGWDWVAKENIFMFD